MKRQPADPGSPEPARPWCTWAWVILAASSHVAVWVELSDGVRWEGELEGAALAPYVFYLLVLAVLSIWKRLRTPSARCWILLGAGSLFLGVFCSILASNFPALLAQMSAVRFDQVVRGLGAWALTNIAFHLLRKLIRKFGRWMIARKWIELVTLQEFRESRSPKRGLHQSRIDEAKRRTVEAETLLSAVQGILSSALRDSIELDWTAFVEPFEEAPPAEPVLEPLPLAPALPAAIPKPNPRDAIYDPGYRAFVTDAFIPSRWRQRKAEAAERLQCDLRVWERNVKEIKAYPDLLRQWRNETKAVGSSNTHRMLAYDVAVAEWALRKSKHELEQNRRAEQLLDSVARGNPAAVERFFRAVLGASKYPTIFPREVELSYDSPSCKLLVDFAMLSPSELPTLLRLNWQKSAQEFSEVHLGTDERRDLYRSVLHQTCLRTLHELVAADSYGVLKAIGFNGWIRSCSPDDSEGKKVCILAVCVDSKEFRALDLEKAPPRSCFEGLGGVESADPFLPAEVEPIGPHRAN